MSNKTNNNKPPRKANKNSQWRNIRDKEKLLVAKDILMFIRATLLARVKTATLNGPNKDPLSYSSQDVGLIWDWLDRHRPLEKLLEAGEEEDNSNSTIDTSIDNSSKVNEHVDANDKEPCDENHIVDNNKDDSGDKE